MGCSVSTELFGRRQCVTRVGGDGEKERVRGRIPGGYAVSVFD